MDNKLLFWEWYDNRQRSISVWDTGTDIQFQELLYDEDEFPHGVSKQHLVTIPKDIFIRILSKITIDNV